VISYCNSTAYVLAVVGVVVGIVSLVIFGTAVALSMKEYTFQDRMPLLARSVNTITLTADNGTPVTLDWTKFTNYFAFIGSIFTFMSLCMLIWMPMATFMLSMSIFFVVFVLYSIHKRWGFTKAWQILTSTKTVDFATAIANSDNPFTEGIPFLTQCISSVGENPTILHRNIHHSKSNVMLILLIILGPITLMMVEMSFAMIHVFSPNSNYVFIMIAAAVAMWVFMFIFAGNTSYGCIVTDTHWVSFNIGLSIIPLEYCVPLSDIEKIEFLEVSTFGVGSHAVTLTAKGRAKATWGGYFDNKPQFEKLVRKLGFEISPTTSICSGCTLSPKIFLGVTATAYIISTVVFIIAMTTTSLMFSLMSATTPMYIMILSMLLGIALVQRKISYKRDGSALNLVCC